MALRFEILSQRSAAMPTSSAPDPTLVSFALPDSGGIHAPAPVPVVEPTPSLFVGPLPPPPAKPAVWTVNDTLRRGDSIYLSLKRHKVPERQLALLDLALRKVFKPAQVRPDDFYAITLDTNDVVQHFCYTPAARPDRPVEVELHDGLLVGRRLTLPLERHIQTLTVTIEDNLSNAISQAGEGDALSALLFDRIYGAVIDFQLDPRRGDRLNAVYEKLYLNGRFVRYGHVLLANYEGQQVQKLGIRYPDSEGVDSYFDGKGESLGRMFLLKPLTINRITSRFNRKRFHPILKKRVPHLGTDYGAPTGTPVWTTARGKITYAGRKGSYGKMVEVTHQNGYRTRYAHLSKIYVQNGQRVQQQERIGAVGATGRATGPHLHYEIIENGRHINPQSVNSGATGQPLAKDRMPAFAQHRDQLLQLLTAPQHLAVGSSD